MGLPQVNLTKFEAKILSTNETVYFRPYKVGEEKAIHLARETGNAKELFNTFFSVIKACFEGVDLDKLKPYDFQYLLIKLREKSVGSVIEINDFKCSNKNCKHIFREQTFDLEKHIIIEGLEDQKIKGVVDLNGKVKVHLEIPNMKTVLKYLKQFSEDDTSSELINLDVVADSITMIEWDEGQTTEFTHDEMMKWLDELDTNMFEKILNFFTNIPTILVKKEVVCPKCGEKKIIKTNDILFF